MTTGTIVKKTLIVGKLPHVMCVCVCVCGKKLRMQIILKQDGHLTSASSGLPIEPLVAMFNLWGTVLRGS